MGGICGVIGTGDKYLIQKMSNAINHRGKNNTYYIDDNIGFCSMVESNESQLSSNENKNIWAAFHGEIYNYFPLMQLLEKEGHEFSTSSDSEIIVHLYESYDERCVEKVNGPFAFALWDSKKGNLFLARDRIGERPLFYTLVNNKLLFASEIKSLLEYEEIKKNLNMTNLEYFFAWGHTPVPHTLFKGVYKIRPAHILKYDKEKRIFEKKFWNWDFKNIDYTIDEDTWCDLIFNTLIDSIKIRLRDGPFGVLLGGIDSSTVASIMTRLTDEPVKSFTLAYEDEEYNEPSPPIISEHLGIEAFRKTFHAKDLIRILPHLSKIFDDLKADTAPSPQTYLGLEFASKHVKTVFTGDGADRNLWSYGWPSPEPILWKPILLSPKIIKERVYQPIVKNYLRDSENSWVNRTLLKLSHILMLSKLSYDTRPLYYLQDFHAEDIRELLNRELTTDLYSPFTESFVQLKGRSKKYQRQVNWIISINKIFESHGWGIARLDPICSQFSLNSRNPIEDYRMKELAAKIPTYTKQPNERQDKYIWRKTIKTYNLLPEKVVNQHKMGFGINPMISQWFKGELKEYIHQTILDGLPSMRHIINKKAVEKVVDKGTTPQKYSLLMFTLWYENFFLN